MQKNVLHHRKRADSLSLTSTDSVGRFLAGMVYNVLSQALFIVLCIVKYVLLHDAGIIAVSGKRALSVVYIVYDFSNPGVDRDKGSTAVRKQGNTVGDFITYAVDGF